MIDQTPQDYDLYHPHPLLIVISGPSGVGKDALVKAMIARDLPFHFVVTYNSRPRRECEVEGVDYFFVTIEQFQQMIAHNELIEYARVYNDYKGIGKEQVRQALASGKDVIMRLDVQGAASVRTLCPDAVLLFLLPGSEAELVQRLKERHSESEESLRIRLNTARQELKRVNEFDYLIVNAQNKLDAAVDTVVAIIEAEHHRVVQRKVTL
jgi:guanylate kinase